MRRYYERDHNDATAAQWNAAMVRTARCEDTCRKHNAMLHALAAGAALGSPMSRKWEDHRRCADG